MPRKTVCETGVRLMHKYNVLSPVMKILFSGDAKLRYAADKDLMPIMDDLIRADRLTYGLFRTFFSNSAQAEMMIRRTINTASRRGPVLNYTANAFAVANDIVYRMAYKHGTLFHSMNSFVVVHPLQSDPSTLQRGVAFLRRFDKTLFSMSNPEYSQYYHGWIKTPQGQAFNQKRLNYTLALKVVMAEQGVTFRRVALPESGVGRAYIREISRQRS